jgi:hypothetical protein
MKKKKYIVAIIMFIVLVIIFLSCKTLDYQYSYIAKQKIITQNEMKIYLNFGIRPAIDIRFFVNCDNLIDNFILINGLVQIGENNIEFDRENITIYGHEIDSEYVIIWEEFGKEHDWYDNINQKRHDLLLNKTDNFHYNFSLHRYIKDNIPEKKKKKSIDNMKIFLEYSMVINDAVIHKTISEEFNIEVKEQKITGFHVIMFYILGGLGILKL